MRYVLVVDTAKAEMDRATPGLIEQVARGDVSSNRGGHGVPPDVVVRELKQVGFLLLTRIDDWPGGQYCLVFQRP